MLSTGALALIICAGFVILFLLSFIFKVMSKVIASILFLVLIGFAAIADDDDENYEVQEDPVESYVTTLEQSYTDSISLNLPQYGDIVDDYNQCLSLYLKATDTTLHLSPDSVSVVIDSFNSKMAQTKYRFCYKEFIPVDAEIYFPKFIGKSEY